MLLRAFLINSRILFAESIHQIKNYIKNIKVIYNKKINKLYTKAFLFLNQTSFIYIIYFIYYCVLILKLLVKK